MIAFRCVPECRVASELVDCQSAEQQKTRASRSNCRRYVLSYYVVFVVNLTLRRASVGDGGDDFMEESDARRSAASLGPSGMAGIVLSPKTLWL